MRDILRKMAEALMEGDEASASSYFSEYINQKIMAESEVLGNVKTKAMVGVPNNGESMPNVYTTKKISKKKKKLPSLKKSVYGTGIAPASVRGCDGGSSGGDAGAGGGGAGE